MADTLWTGRNNDKVFEQSGSFTSTVKVSLYIGSVATSPSGISTIDSGDDVAITNHSGNEFIFFLSGKFSTTVKQSFAMYPEHLYSNDGVSPDEVNTLVGGLGDQADDSDLLVMSGKITSTVKDSMQTDAWGTPKDISSDGINTTWTTFGDFYWFSGQITSTVKDSFDFTASSDREGIGWDGFDTLSIGYSLDKLAKYSGRFTSTVKDSENVSAKEGSQEGIESSNFNLRVGLGNFVDITLPMIGITTMNVIVLPVLEVWAGSQGAWFDLPILTVGGWMQTTNDGDIALPMLSLNTFANPGNNRVSITLPILTVEAEKIIRANGNVILPMFSIDTVVQQGSVENVSLTMPILTLSAFSGQVVRVTLPSFSINAVGQSGIRGLYNKGLPRLQVVGYGTLHQHGNANVRIPLFSLQTNLINGIISISTDIVLPVLTTNFHGFRGENGNVDITFPLIETATNVALNPNGDVSLTLFALKLDAYADVYINRFI